MADRCQKAQNSVSQQVEAFRLAESAHGLSTNTLHLKTEIPVSTLAGWATGTVMPAWALFQLGATGPLGGGIPAYLLSLIGEPFGQSIVETRAESDLDRVAQIAAEYTFEYTKARNLHGPGGVSITPGENAVLVDLAKQLAGAARVAA